MRRKLYSWQEECLDKWQANQGRGMIQAVTGSGKTVLALSAMDRLRNSGNNNLQVRIVVPTGGLARQWKKALKQWLEDNNDSLNGQDSAKEIVVWGAGVSGSGSSTYMIYVINSARYRLARQILLELQEQKAVFLIADECHHYDSEQNKLIFEFLPHIEPYESHFFSMGLSATLPRGEAKVYLSSVLGKEIYNYGMKEAMNRNTICRYDVFHIGISFSGAEADEYQELTERMRYAYLLLQRKGVLLESKGRKELFKQLSVLTKHENPQIATAANTYMTLTYKRENLICLASARVPCACHLIDDLGIQDKILVFGERIEQINELYERLALKYSGRVGRYHSKMGQQANQNTLERFRQGEIRILLTCKSVDEGMDIPDVSIGIVLSGTSTQRQRTQRLGRVVRRADGKERAALYYLHLLESAEESVFLPEAEDINILELEYQIRGDKLLHPIYDKKAKILLQSMYDAGADDVKMGEAHRVLRVGRVRADWINGHCDFDTKIENASGMKERNYWVCMKKLSGIL